MCHVVSPTTHRVVGVPSAPRDLHDGVSFVQRGLDRLLHYTQHGAEPRTVGVAASAPRQLNLRLLQPRQGLQDAPSVNILTLSRVAT